MPQTVSVHVDTMDAVMEFSIRNNTRGKQLFDKVAGMIGLREVWYFGLQFVDNKGSVSWLVPEKKIVDQDVKKETPLRFTLRVKFYPEDLAEELIQDVTRRLFFLQVKEDVEEEKILCPAETAVLLSSYVLQARLGEYKASVHRPGYLSSERLLPRRILEQQSPEKWEDQIRIQHERHKSMMKDEAVMEYLKVAQKLETLGVMFFEIQMKDGTNMWLGVDAHGVKIYLKDDRLKPKIRFYWNEIKNIVHSERKYVIKPVDRKWPEFVFSVITPPSNKENISYWCTRNQELHSRRRRSDSIEVQQMKAQVQQERLQRRLEREQVEVERRRREAMEREKQEMERQNDEMMRKLMQYRKEILAAKKEKQELLAQNALLLKMTQGRSVQERETDLPRDHNKRILIDHEPIIEKPIPKKVEEPPVEAQPVLVNNRAAEKNLTQKQEDPPLKTQQVVTPVPVNRPAEKELRQKVLVQKRKLKTDLFTDPKVFHIIDAHVVKVGSELFKKRVCDLKTIVQNITLGARTDLEKIRAIYVWLCHFVAYDVSGSLGLTKMLSSTDEVLATGRGVCSGYGAVCQDMCREVGIQCEKVTGHSKGSGYQQGQSLAGVTSDHMWNAVHLGGDWFLLDACWGAGVADLAKRSFTRRFNEFYFLTDPDEFVDAHFPDERKWQLLDSPVSLEEFEKRVKRTAKFFGLGLELVEPRHCHVFTYGGEATVTLALSRRLVFTYDISPQQQVARRTSSKSSGFLTVDRDRMDLRVVPPARGKYDVNIYAKLLDDQENSLSLVCSFIVECLTPTSMGEIPDNPSVCWGLDPKAESRGVTGSSVKGYLAEVDDGSFQISLRTSRPLSMVCDLVHPDLQASVTKRCLVTQIQPDLLTCSALFLSRGFYRLSVFVRDFEKKELELQNAATFLIHCRGRVAGADQLFPADLNSTCGPGTKALEAGLSDFSHTSPFIDTAQSHCSVSFHNQQNLEILAEIMSDGRKSEIPLSRYVFCTYEDRRVTLSVNLPGAGTYGLGLYAKTKPGTQFDHMCDYVVRNACERPAPPFPSVYGLWKKGCELLEPRSGRLDPDCWTRFRVRVPGALEVGVFGETYSVLKQDNTGVWEGQVSSGNGVKQLNLAASWNQSNTQKFLLGFEVKK